MPVAATVERYNPPPVSVGMTVIWANDPSRLADGAPGIVTRVSPQAIDISFVAPDARQLNPRSGVRHFKDPGLAKIVNDVGVWDYTDETKRLHELEARLAAPVAAKGK